MVTGASMSILLCLPSGGISLLFRIRSASIYKKARPASLGLPTLPSGSQFPGLSSDTGPLAKFFRHCHLVAAPVEDSGFALSSYCLLSSWKPGLAFVGWPPAVLEPVTSNLCFPSVCLTLCSSETLS